MSPLACCEKCSYYHYIHSNIIVSLLFTYSGFRFKINSTCECVMFIGRCNEVWDVFMSAWALCALSPQVDVWRPQYLTLRPLVRPLKPVTRGSSVLHVQPICCLGGDTGKYVEICWEVTFLVCLLGYFTMTYQLVTYVPSNGTRYGPIPLEVTAAGEAIQICF